MEGLGLVGAFGTRSGMQRNPDRPQLIIYSLGAAFPRVKEMAWWVKHLLYKPKGPSSGPQNLWDKNQMGWRGSVAIWKAADTRELARSLKASWPGYIVQW